MTAETPVPAEAEIPSLRRAAPPSAKGAVLVAIACAGFALVLTLHALLSRSPSPVWDDTMEAWALGRQLEFGYYKHPPLMAWVARLWFEVFPRADWSAYLLAAVTQVVGLAGLWRIAGRYLKGRARVAATLLPMLTFEHTVLATNFNANTILLAVWPWTIEAFLAALARPTILSGALFGVMVALALLAKYVSVLLVLTCLVAALLSPARHRAFLSPAPYVAVFVAVLLLAPHLAWLQSDHQAIGYAFDRMQPSSKMSKPLGALTTVLGALAMLAPAGFALAYAVGPTRLRAGWRSVRSAARLEAPLIALAVLPFLLIELMGLSDLFKIQTNFLIPAVFLLPTMVLVLSRLEVSGPDLHRLLRVLIVAATILLAASPLVAWALFKAESRYMIEPVRDVTRFAAGLWHARFKTPLKVVGGSELYSLGQTFYGPDRPQEFTHFDMRQAPWMTRLRDAGMSIVCSKSDGPCASRADALVAAARQSSRAVEIHNYSAHTSLYGVAGPERPFVIYLIGPAGIP